jgi:hypothetical protein
MSFIRYPLGGEYHVQFTARRSWMANIYYQGKPFDLVPVTWTPDLNLTDRTLWVHFTSEDRMHAVRAAGDFDVVVADAQEYHKVTPGDPLKFDEFVSLYRVRPTSRVRNGRGSHRIMQTDLVRRLHPRPTIIY